MPIILRKNLPAIQVLQQENIFFMNESRAAHQDIRPLKVAILNLMPDKQTTEVQLLRMLSNTPLQIEITLLHTKSHISKHTSLNYLQDFYKTFDDVKCLKFDGMIITGTPVEHMKFEEVNFWKEFTEIMDWSCTNVTSTIFLCWASMAGLYHHYGVPKYVVNQKIFGVFPHSICPQYRKVNLFMGYDDIFYVPHSRLAEVRKEDILKIPELSLLAESEESGVHIVMAKNGRQFFIMGHSEYDRDTLKKEYERDLAKGEEIQLPKNYFPNDDPTKEPLMKWRGHANLLFSNWLNYYVYQSTPYEW